MKGLPQLFLMPPHHRFWLFAFVLTFFTSAVAQRSVDTLLAWLSQKSNTGLVVEVQSSPYENNGGLVEFSLYNETHSWIHVRITDSRFVLFEGTLAPTVGEGRGEFILGWPVSYLAVALPPHLYTLAMTGEHLEGSTTDVLVDPSKTYTFTVKTKPIESSHLKASPTAVNGARASNAESRPVEAAIKQDFTSEQIASAVSRGIRNAGQPQGLVLQDTGAQFAEALGVTAAQHSAVQPGSQVVGGGFQVWAFTPLHWVSEQASEAAGQGRSFTTSDVTPDMLRPVFRVKAFPATKPPAGPNYGLNVSPVVNAVLKDASQKNQLQPTARAPFSFEGMQGQIFEFPMDGLANLREKNPEFFIVVIGTNGTDKEFKVKKKHFPQLE